MKHIKIITSITHKFCAVILLIFILLPTGELLAQKKKKKKTQNLELRIKGATIYDNNILKYSEKYLDRFMKGQDQGRFHINTYDDIILYTSIQLYWSFKIFGNLKSKINGEVSRRKYIVNDIKSWDFFTIGFQQNLSKRASIKILYSYIPEFYVRHFRDALWVDIYGYTPITFKPYSFSKDNFGIYIQNTFFKNTRIKLSLYYARYYHNEYYTEFDSKDLIYGIKLYQPLHKKFKIDISYQFVTSDAKGYNSAIETPETTHGPDATFEEDRFTLGFIWYLPRIKKHRHNLDVRSSVLLRYYSSQHPPLIDPLHAGRVDHNYRLSAKYNFHVNKMWRLSAYYKFYLRDSDTKALINSLYVSNEKDYTQFHIGFEVEYKINF